MKRKNDIKTRLIIGISIISVTLIGCLIYKMNNQKNEHENDKNNI